MTPANEKLGRGEPQLQASAPQTSATDGRGAKEWHSYKPLRKEFRHNGFNYRLIAREGDAAIYEQTWRGCSSPSPSYEVIQIRRREGVWIGSTFVEPAEVYPKAEAWGVDGWTFQGKDAAFRKLREVVASFGFAKSPT